MQQISFARHPYRIDRANAVQADDPRVNTKKGVAAKCSCAALRRTEENRIS
jgi:hypothetical protein